MKKIKIAITAVLALSLILTSSIFIYKQQVLKNDQYGYLLFTAESEDGYRSYDMGADNVIYVYDIKNDVQKAYSIDGYKIIYLMNKYVGGDFCCIGIKENSDEKNILLVKDGAVFKKMPLLFEEEFKMIADSDFVYYLINGQLIRQTAETSDTFVVAENVDCFDISEQGKLAYLLNDRVTLYVESEKYSLNDYYRGFYWISAEELLLFNSSKYVKYDLADKSEKSISSMSECLYVRCVNENRVVCEFPNDYDTFTALVDLKANAKKSFFLNKSNISGYFYFTNAQLWLNNNPFDSKEEN